MARTVLTVAGYVVGSYFGYPELGAIVGGLVGGALEPNAHIQGPRLTDLTAPQASYGAVIPYIEGAWRTAGIFIWSSDKRAVANESSDGGKGGPGVDTTTFTYEMDVLIEFTINEMQAIRRVWSNGRLVWNKSDDATDGTLAASEDTNSWDEIRFYSGAADQLPDPDYEAAVGIGNAPAYRGRSTVFIKSLNLGQSGQLPILTFEILSEATSSFTGISGAAAQGVALGGGGSIEPGSAAFSVTGFTYHIPQWDNFYGNADVLVYQYTVGDPSAVPIGGYTVDVNTAETMLGTTDVSCLCQSNGTTKVDLYSDVPNSQPFMTTSSHFDFTGILPSPSKRTRFARKGPWIVMGSDNFSSDKRLYKCPTSGPTYSVLSATLPDAVQSMCISDDGFVYAANTATGGLVVYELDLLTMTLQATIPPPVGLTDTLVNIVCDGSTLYMVSATDCWRYTGSGWVNAFANLPAGIFLEGAGHQAVAVIGTTMYSVHQTFVSGPPVTHTAWRTVDTVVGGGVFLDAVVSRLCLRTGQLTPSDIDVTELTADVVKGLAIAQVAPTRQAIESLMAGYYFEAVEDGTKIKFVKRGGTEVLTVPYRDLGASASDQAEPLPLQRLNDLELPARVTVKYSNVDNDYQDGAESGARLVTQSTSDQVVELPLAFTPAEAKKIADVNTMDLMVSLIGVGPVSVSRKYAKLEPTDVMRLTAKDGSTFRGRVQKATFATGVNTYELVLDDATVINSEIGTDDSYASSSLVQGTSSTAQQLLDIPILRDADNDAGFYDQVKPSSALGWGGAVIYSSDDDVTLTREGDISARAVFGGATTTLGNWTGPRNFDEINSVVVNVGAGTLSSSTREALLGNQAINAFALGRHGRWELGQFRIATLLSAGVYQLTSLIRGSRGTEWAMGTHAAGDLFSLLSASGIRRLPMNTTLLGIPRFYRAVTLGRNVDNATSASFADTGVGLKPFSPFDARVQRDPVSADITITWQRRTRLATRTIGVAGISVPLGEATNIFSVDIYSSGAYTTVVRTITSGVFIVGGEIALYSAAQQVADFGSTQSTIYFRVYQLSQVVGRGYPVQAAA